MSGQNEMKKNKYHIPQIKLNTEYEYVNILTRTEGSRNALQEPVITWVTTANVKCFKTTPNLVSAEALVMFTQGLIQISNYWAMFESDASLTARDHVIDEDSNIYDVMEMKDYKTHKEALLKTVEKG